MAASRMKNDFAPAWLKLPNQENVKPMTPRNVGDWTFERSFSERGKDCHMESAAYDDIMSTPRVTRQKAISATRSGSISGYHSSNNNNNSQRSRVKPGRGTQSYNYVNGMDCDMPVTDHHAREGGLSSIAKDLSYQVDRFTGCSPDGTVNTREQKADSAKDQANNSIEDEFPSLNSEVLSYGSKPSYSKVASVWDGSVRESGVVVRVSSVTPIELGPKPLVLKTAPVKRAVTDIDKQSNGASKSSGVPDSSKPKTLRNSLKEPQPSVMTTTKVLTACLKQPKESGDRKSNFFKLMRRESHESNTDLSQTEQLGSSLMTTLTETCPISRVAETKGISSMTTAESIGSCSDVTATSAAAALASPVEVVFSSEGELRLMHEMGWNETDYDGEEYEITEDDVREFQALCHKLQQERLSHPKSLSNGFAKANGYVAKVLNSLTPLSPPSSPGVALPSLSSVGSDFSDDSDVCSS